MKFVHSFLLLISLTRLFADISSPTLILDTGVKIYSNEKYPYIIKKYPLFWAIDMNEKTAWVHETENKSIELTFIFPLPKDIDGIKIINGYSKSKNLYCANNGISQVLLNDLIKEQKYFLNETLEAQYITLVYKNISSVKLQVQQVVKGNKYDDSCISEIHIYSNGEDLLSPKKSFISIGGGEYASYTLYDSQHNQIVHFEPEQIERAFYIEDGRYSVFIHASEMWMPGITIVNNETNKSFLILERMNILAHTLRWEKDRFIGRAIDPKTDVEFSFEEKVELK